ncbi:hypothetical protein H9P43_000310 [Blastocladiella emersonii ATCC 22665]|nr:hypothetical protein H9P43_000310 [Blastocladiella emersonii ATCC 22665]
MPDAVTACFDLAASYEHGAATKAALRIVRLLPSAKGKAKSSLRSSTAAGTGSAASLRNPSGAPASLGYGSDGLPLPPTSPNADAVMQAAVDALSQLLAHAFRLEAMYTSLALSRPRRMFGRETLDEAYRVLQSDCERDRPVLDALASLPHHLLNYPLERTASTRSLGSASGAAAQLDLNAMMSLTNPLIHLCQARVLQIQIWRRLAQCADAEDLVSIVPIVEGAYAELDFSLLARLSPAFSALIQREMHVLISLLRTERGIYYHQLPDALSNLYTAQALLAEWKAAAFPNDGAASLAKSFLSSNASALPAHLTFWWDFTHHYLAKMSLHFSRLQFPGQKAGTALTTMIEDSLKPLRGDASFHLMYHVPSDRIDSFEVSGYAFPRTPSAPGHESSPSPSPPGTAASSGVASKFPVLYSYPADLAPADRATVCAVLLALNRPPATPPQQQAVNYSRSTGGTVSSTSSSAMSRPMTPISALETASTTTAATTTRTHAHRPLEVGELLPYVDAKVGRSYYLARLGEHLYAVVVLADRRPRDTATIDFLTAFKAAIWGQALLKSIP